MPHILEEQADYFLGDSDASTLAQAVVGQQEEYEHTNDPDRALRVALEHLNEDRDYYFKLFPAMNKDGYQIDFIGRCPQSNEMYYVSVVCTDPKAGWFVDSLVIIQSPQHGAIDDIYFDSISSALNRTYYNLIWGNSASRIGVIPFFRTITDQVGYDGWHSPHIKIDITEFISTIQQYFHIERVVKTF